MSPIIIALTPGDRLQLATTIERLINMLDEIEGDCDFEASFGSGDDREADYPCEFGDSDYEPSMGANECREGQSQAHWGLQSAPDETEEENEHGGDIQDERHDGIDEGNDEPFLGWAERESQWQVSRALDEAEAVPETSADPNDIDVIDYRETLMLQFEGNGYREGKDQLRNLKRRRPDRHQEHVRTSPALGWMI